MIPIKRQERRKLGPPITQLLVCIIPKPTRIRPDHRNLEKLKLEHALDVHIHVHPFARIVPQPVACPFAGTRKCGTADEEGSFVGVDGEQGEVCCSFFHESPEVVDVDVGDAAGVGGVGGDGVEGEGAEAVVDGIGWGIDVGSGLVSCSEASFGKRSASVWSIVVSECEGTIDGNIPTRSPYARVITVPGLNVSSMMLA